MTLEDEIRALMTAEGKGASTVEDYVKLADCQRRTVMAALKLVLEEEHGKEAEAVEECDASTEKAPA